jgi:uncharacterized membrane protein
MSAAPARRPDGFLERGATVTRLEAFVDATFAFAVTLLVIALSQIPASIPAMLDALKGVPAFAASFVQILLFWAAHVTWSRRFGLDDARSTQLSLFMVFLVLVYVYPLKILFSAFFAWISNGWLPAVAPIHTLGDLQGMFVMYALAFGTLSFCMVLLNRHALNANVSPPLEPGERLVTRGEIVRWWYSIAVAAVSMAAAWWMPANVPGWMYGMPGMAYGLLGLTHWVVRAFVPEPSTGASAT